MTLSDEPAAESMSFQLLKHQVGRLDNAVIDLRLRCDKLERRGGFPEETGPSTMRTTTNDSGEAAMPVDEQHRLLESVSFRIGGISNDIAEIKLDQERTSERVKQMSFDVRNHARTLNQLPDWQFRIDESLNGLGQRVASIGKKQEEHDKRFDALDGKVDALDGKVNALDGKLDKVLAAVGQN